MGLICICGHDLIQHEIHGKAVEKCKICHCEGFKPK